ncbi:MAG: DUF1559 domain-containing protein [Thermoguttaceae bacterium]|nr:DUF1559 domain-containing protein [Thermoguttaceae bacterium]MBR5759733.1 DUF1559 domain-containing protein [Thermoguttaceae bacterium]
MDAESLQLSRRRRALVWVVVVFLAFCAVALFFTLSCFLLAMRENARRERCDLNLAKLYQATVEYCDANGSFPPAFTQNEEGKRLHSWRVLLLPYLGEQELFSQIKLDEPWDSDWNKQFWTKTPNVFRCASTPTADVEDDATKAKKCAYSCVIGPNTAFPEDGTSVRPSMVVDGLSNAVMYVERKNPSVWMDPYSEITVEQALEENKKPVRERENFGSWHGKGEYALLCDGGRRFLSEKIDDSVLRLLFGIDDSKEIEESVPPPEEEQGDENR